MSRPSSRFRDAPRRGLAGLARTARRLLVESRGTGAVEFALVAVPFVVLLVGTVEVARVVWTQTALERTAISGARCIGIRSQSCTRNGAYDEARARAFVSGEASGWGLSLPQDAIAIADNAACGDQPSHSTVTLTTDIFSPLPFVATMMAGSPTMSARACFPTHPDPAAG